jgi:hypothetical protein
MNTVNYEVGDTIICNVPSDVAGIRRTVVVTMKLDDVKNGRPGFDGKIVGSGVGVWGYDYQIIRVIKA